jgi:hypothetical protein
MPEPRNDSTLILPRPAHRAWRFRRCPRCRVVRAAGDFEQIDFGSNWREGGLSRRRCPDCGHVGPTADFSVVRERRAS